MKTKEKIEIMQAYLNGKTIEARQACDTWQYVCGEPLWDWYNFDYRIKSEPKYRPYNSVEEFLQASKEHGPYLKVINDKGAYQTYVLPLAMIGGWIDFNGAVSDNDIKHEAVAYNKLLGKYTWQDGTYCGILE